MSESSDIRNPLLRKNYGKEFPGLKDGTTHGPATDIPTVSSFPLLLEPVSAITMVDWHSPDVIAEDELIFLKIDHILFGLYCWEVLISLDFDWQYISGKRRFRWPMVFYFLNRYVLFVCLIGVIIALNVTTKVNCQALYTFNQFTGSLSVGLVCINFAIRTMAVWALRWYIVAPLVVIILGHLGIILHGVYLKAEWNPQGGGCIITQSDPKTYLATFLYSMCFDFLLICLTGYKLHVQMSATGFSRLARLIFHDGLVYFIIAFLVNVVAVTFSLMNLNPIMAIIPTGSAVCISTIVVTRSIRRLANSVFTGTDVYHISIPQQTVSGHRTRTTATVQPSSTESKPGVHIQMQTYQHFDTRDDLALASTQEQKPTTL